MFSDFALTRDHDVLIQMLLRLFIAAILGGLLGWQSGAAGKNAGMRTYMLKRNPLWIPSMITDQRTLG